MKIKHVYDWIGSLATYLEYFHLVDFQNRIVQEDDKIDTIKFVLNMTETSAELAKVSKENKSDAATMNFDEVYDIGNEETERFLNNVEEKCNEHNIVDGMKENQAQCNCRFEENIKNTITSYQFKLYNVVKVFYVIEVQINFGVPYFVNQSTWP